MDRFHQMRVFVAVAEEHGFAGAARKLDLSPPAVTRAVAALEQHLGVKLLKRTTRHVRMTESGVRYYDDAKRILAELQVADDAVAGINTAPRGVLKVTAPALFGRLFVLPTVLEFLEQYADISIETLFLDRVVSLVEEGIDVGVRIGHLPDSNMRALLVGHVRVILVASPNYLAQNGIPRQLGELETQRLIVSRTGSFSSYWQFQAAGQETAVRVAPRLTVSTNDAAIASAKSGFGISRVLSYQAATELASGELKTILQEYEPAPLPVHIVHREDRSPPVKVRAFIDLLAEQLRTDNTLNG